MKSRGLIIAIAASAITLTSCVSNKKYSSLQGEYDALNKEYNATQMALAESRANNKSLETMLAEARKRNQELKDDYAALQGSLDQSLKQSAQGSVNISKLVDEINASNKYIKQLVEAKSKSDSLNMVLTNNLTRSLSRDELQDVDIKVLKGVVYISLADNMLFKSGSYQIIIRKTKCSYFPKRNVLPPKTKRTFFSPLISDRHNPFQGCGGSIFMRL